MAGFVGSIDSGNKTANRSWALRAALAAVAGAFSLAASGAWAQSATRGAPSLGDNTITQEQIENGLVTRRQIRRQGLFVFSTPITKADGYGDGPMNPADPTPPGGRPTLQDNGTFLRVNGLDGQSCLECHSIVSHREVPARFGIGGVGGSVSNAIVKPRLIDVDDEATVGFASFDGRFINPPFLFGSGGVELLGKEMTLELQALKAEALADPGVDVPLVTKGVDFGSIRHDGISFDTSNVVGVDADLVVRPFGRKGEFATVRAFDDDAMQFHFGVQPVEVVGENVDADGDGVINEITVGEISSLAIFNTTLERPDQRNSPGAQQGFALFSSIGCTDCHKPFLTTQSRELTYSFPEIEEDPTANVFFSVDLSGPPMKFRAIPNGGVVVPLFADLKRHDMGPALAESFGSELDSQFTTARLWGVADTAPYLHDGRAHTLSEAILLHGGDAQVQRDAFAGLATKDQDRIVDFLLTLRTPANPAKGLLP